MMRLGVAVFAMWSVFAAASAQAETPADAPAVKTRQGTVRGKLDGSVREFFGIPYAAAPVGNLRWRAPEPHPNWTNPLEAFKPANSCPQVDLRTRQLVGSEDCLYLNIYTPASGDRGLPVMVWIHGGTFVAGSGSIYNGHDLAEKGRLIVVTINYRLGPFGFLANRNLAAGEPQFPANYGLLDQQAALRWVKDNIEAFGGDPGKVTMAGESAGGQSVVIHLASPAAAGLFARAIIESGPLVPLPTLADAQAKGDEFAAMIGCAGGDVAACLRSKSTREVMMAMPTNPLSAQKPMWFPVFDGHLVPSQPADAFAAGRVNKVPLINGSNHDEGTLFLGFGPQITADQYALAVRSQFGAGADRVLAAYPLAHYPSPTQASAAGFGDSIFSCTALRAGELFSAWAPVYEYEFNDQSAPNVFTAHPPFPFGAYHGAEIQYVFGTVLKNRESLSADQRALADAMTGYWIDFIRSGDPGGTPRWLPFSAASPRVLLLAPGSIRFETDFAEEHHCALWGSLGRK